MPIESRMDGSPQRVASYNVRHILGGQICQNIPFNGRQVYSRVNWGLEISVAIMQRMTESLHMRRTATLMHEVPRLGRFPRLALRRS